MSSPPPAGSLPLVSLPLNPPPGESNSPNKPVTSIRPKGKKLCCVPKSGRNICVSAEGTLGEFGEKNSNVVEFHSRIINDEKQLTYYIAGIGTYGRTRLQRATDSAIATSFQRNVLKAYEWLCNTYEPGDRIFLFGFSRGAYQVRVIAGMIERVGLLHKGNNSQLPSVFKLYMNAVEGSYRTMTSASGQSEAQKQCKTFKDAFSRKDVKVHFVGTWDTVSSVGIIRGPSLPDTTTGMKYVCHFRQALALDERRVRFWPEYANGATNSPARPPEEFEKEGDVKEVWFAGSHSDIGGGNRPNKDLNNFGPSLRWMTYEATIHGLRMREHTGGWEKHVPTNSLKWLWHIFEGLPLLRPSYSRGVSRSPHWYAPRKIQPGQKIHESVFTLMGIATEGLTTGPSVAVSEYQHVKGRNDGHLSSENSGSSPRPTTSVPTPIPSPDRKKEKSYRPSARLQDGTWEKLIQDPKKCKDIIEADPYASAFPAAEKLKSAIDNLKTPRSEVSSPKKAVMIEAVMGLKPHVSDDVRMNSLTEVQDLLDTLLSALDIVKRDEALQTEPDLISVLFLALKSVPSGFDRNDPLKLKRKVALFRSLSKYGETTRLAYPDVVLRHGDGLLDVIQEPSQNILDTPEHIAFSHDGSHIFAASYTGVATWDYKTKARVRAKSFEEVNTVAMSPKGSRYATGSSHRTSNAGLILVENVTSSEMTLRLEKHQADITFVTFSEWPDESKLASGSKDGSIRVWDSTTGEDLFGWMEGHDEGIENLKFSPDGKKLASASNDHTIRVWDIKNGKQTMVLEGHTDEVWSLAFFPEANGGCIVSGSCDRTIRIWDPISGHLVKTLEGHTDTVVTLAVSPDGKLIASGGESRDKTLRIWDANSGEALAVYYTGSGVRSLAFSPDSKRVVIGTYHGGISIWDADLLLDHWGSARS